MKLRKKLIMSAVALAACAATLTSTTYAWYVSNNQANATEIAGSTAAAGGDGNILVAKNADAEGSTPGAFEQNISFAGDTTNIKIPTSGLNPVSKDTETIKPDSGATGWHGVDLSAVAETNAYMAWDIWVLSTKKTAVTVELTVNNSTANPTEQTCYNATGAPVAQGETFAIDAVEALRMEIFQDGESLGVFSVKDIATNVTHYTVDETTKKVTTTATGATFTDLGSGNANSYYKALLGQDPAGGVTVEDPAETFTGITVTANEASKLSFKVWLEGTDSACFDSCAGQDFQFSFAFKTE